MRSIILFAAAAFSFAAPLAAQTSPRTPWTTSKFHGTPEPPLPCVVERVVPHITFSRPLEIVRFPLGDRMVVIEQRGKVFTFKQNTTSGDPDLLADLKQFNPEVRECYSIAFHPNFKENRYAFLFIILDGKGKPNRDDGTLIVRFKVTGDDVPRLDIASAKTILTFVSGGHNGGTLRFGPDGMLYISVGDSEVPDPPDPRHTGQDLSDLSSNILRIDVDHEEDGKLYRIPPDNPFVKLEGARGEIWAYGLRNPWRMAFTPDGDLMIGDVGWELWEAIYRGDRGRNFGWSITEASKQPVYPGDKPGPTPITPPLVAHSHEESMSITAGETYQGKRVPALRGAFIYGDYECGRIWAIRHDGDKLTEQREIVDTTLKPAGFGVDHDGEVLIADHGGGGIWRLAPNPDVGKPSTFPRRLSESGLFENVTKQSPAAGVHAYDVLAARFADHATGKRLIGLPGGATIGVIQRGDGPLPGNRWDFPPDTVLAKTYSLELTRGKPETSRPIETQILHYSGQTWFAYTYRWNDAGTDAELVGASGDQRDIDVTDTGAPGGKRKQTWRFHSRAECQRCHNAWVNFTPGFNRLQLDYRKSEDDTKKWEAITGLKLERDEPKLVDPYTSNDAPQVRARSYLHANCGSCHRFGGGGSVPTFFNIETKLENARMLDAHPTQGTLGLPDGRVIAQGDPYRSVVLLRMATTGRGHMPYVGSKLVDDRGVTLIRNWIAGMPRSAPASEDVRDDRHHQDAMLQALIGGDAKQISYLLQSTSGSLAIAMAITDGMLTGEIRQAAIDRGSALADPLRRDLFQRFLPDDRRRTVLGDAIDAKAILDMKGDVTRGRAIFFQDGGGQCTTCHRVGNEGTAFGPDLTKIAQKHKPDELMAQLLEPSKKIDEPWRAVLVETDDGAAHTGFITAKTNDTITLRIAGGKDVTIAVKSILSQRGQQLSLMPQGLLANLTAQEAADLLAFLASLK